MMTEMRKVGERMRRRRREVGARKRRQSCFSLRLLKHLLLGNAPLIWIILYKLNTQV